MTYYRNSNENPMSDWGHAMFSSDWDKSSMYGEYHYRYDGKYGVEIESLREEIMTAWNEDAALGYEHLTAEEAFGCFAPSDIVNSAEGYDVPELLTWLCENFVIPNEIKAIITPDGAIVFDETLIQHMGADKDLW